MKKKILPALLAALMLLCGIGLEAKAEDTAAETVCAETEPSCIHEYSEWEEAGSGCRRVCTLCSAEETQDHSWGDGTSQEPTCTAEGSLTRFCSFCGAAKSETIAATGHSFSDWTPEGEESHSRSCSSCGLEETAEHSLKSKVTKEPTCQESGTETYTCKDCGYSRTEVLPISEEHSFEKWTVEKNTHSRTCKVCGAQKSGKHSLDEGTVTTEAACDRDGVMTYTCEVCGGELVQLIPKLEHTYGAEWFSDDKEHWRECMECGKRREIKAHKPGPEATEEREQLCTECGYVLAEKLEHTHDYGTQWVTDRTGHWYACSGCSVKKDAAQHTYEFSCSSECTVCGYERGSAHIYDDNWFSDETGHWRICKVCLGEGDTEPHAADPNADATKDRYCLICKFPIGPGEAAHTHDQGLPWETDDASHWRTCSCGQTVDEALHRWDEGEENGDGTQTFRCVICGQKRLSGTPEKESGGSPVVWIVLIVLLLLCTGAVAALVVILRMNGGGGGKFSRPKDDPDWETFDGDITAPVPVSEFPDLDPEEPETEQKAFTE